jgi:hypothetical protein
MSVSGETGAAIVTHLFKEEDAPLGPKWLVSVSTGWTDISLHRLVAKTGAPSAAKTKELYGHLCTKTQVVGCDGPYWVSDPYTTVKAKATCLNTLKEDTSTRLTCLRMGTIGGFLVVTSIVDTTGMSIPFLTLLVAPSMATFNATTGEPGVLLADIWDDAALANFLPHLAVDAVHCPLMGAPGGFFPCEGPPSKCHCTPARLPASMVPCWGTYLFSGHDC